MGQGQAAPSGPAVPRFWGQEAIGWGGQGGSDLLSSLQLIVAAQLLTVDWLWAACMGPG